MSYYKRYYRKSTGSSRFKGAVLESLNDIKYSISDGYQNLKKSSKRRNALLITMSCLGLYLFNKDSVDSWFDNVNESFNERAHEINVRRAERRTANYLEESKKELYSVRNEISGLVSARDSLAFLVKDLHGEATSVLERRNYLVDSVRREISVLENKRVELEKSVSNRVVSNTESESSSFASKIKNYFSSNRNDDFDYWVPVKSGSSLSEVARMYYGSASEFSSIAKINGIEDPNFVVRMQPVKLCSDKLVNFNGVNKGVMPLFERVNRNEFIGDFVDRLGLSISVVDVVNYNNSLGNNISVNNRLVDNTGVVYLKKDWVD